MNILTFDIEEWYIEKSFHGARKEKYASFDRVLNLVLELLETHNTKATFFCLGKIASEFPFIIKKIVSYGHEIGSHSNKHDWITKLNRFEFEEDIKLSINSLEALTGKKVVSFRAPAFSIGKENIWALETLAKNGIQNDASIFPAVRDFGGFPEFKYKVPCKIKINSFEINEFPIPLYHIPFLNKDLAYSGGGYFRILPLKFITNKMRKSNYNMCYFHIADLITDRTPLMSKNEFENYFKEKGTLKNRYLRYLKSNIGHNSSFSKLEYLLANFKFVSIEEFLRTHRIENHIKLEL